MAVFKRSRTGKRARKGFGHSACFFNRGLTLILCSVTMALWTGVSFLCRNELTRLARAADFKLEPQEMSRPKLSLREPFVFRPGKFLGCWLFSVSLLALV